MLTIDFKAKSKKDVDQAVVNALLARALWMHNEKEIDILKSDIENEKDTAYISHVCSRRLQMLAFIRRETKKAAFHKFSSQTLPKAGKVCAILLLGFYIMLTTAIATVESVRIKVTELLINMTGEYAELRLQESVHLSFDVPVGWKGEYFPSAIPDKYMLSQIVDQHFAGYNSVSYENSDGTSLYFIECTASSETNLDIENADIEFIMVNGNPALLSQKNGFSFVAWSEFEQYFVLGTNENSETAIKIAESVVRIK